MAEVRVRWIGWVRDTEARPMVWLQVPETGRETWAGCFDALNYYYPDPVYPKPVSPLDMMRGGCRYTKWAGKKGETPSPWCP